MVMTKPLFAFLSHIIVFMDAILCSMFWILLYVEHNDLILSKLELLII